MKELRNRNVKSVFGGIGIASLLCVLMVLMSWAAMVNNSDINSIDSDSADSQEVNTDSTGDFDAEIEKTSFEAESIGFDEDLEMIGMRTTHSKTFINDDGNLQSVHSYNPLHYENQYGELIDLDTTILSNENGYYVEDIFTPVQFSHNPMDGAQILIGEDVLVTGLNPVPVTVFQGTGTDPFLDGIMVPYTNINPVRDGVFMPPTDHVKVGGNSINYPMSANIDMEYHVSVNELKQDFVINKLSNDVRTTLVNELETYREIDGNSVQGYFGMQETVGLPDDVELWSNGEQIIADGEVFVTDSAIDIVKADTGLVIGYIAAPFAYDSSLESNNVKEELNKEDKLAQLEASTQYFMTLDANTLTITTAVNIDWLLDDYTSFPVVIDPSVGTNTINTDSAGGNYQTCDIGAEDCHSSRNSRFLYDYPSWGGDHQSSPTFDFTFNHGVNTLPIGSVSAVYELDWKYSYTGFGDYGGLIIMEECGGYALTLGSSGDPDLNGMYNPGDCTGNPLPDYQMPPTPPSTAQHVFSGFSDYTDCQTDNDIYGTNQYQYSMTSDMTTCDGSSVDFVSGSSSFESNGIFDAGSYEYIVTDSYGDGLNSNAAVYFQTRTIGASNAAWTDLVTVGDFTGAAHDAEDDGYEVPRYFTVNAGDEMRIAYNCPTSGCWPSENSATVKQAPAPPVLPAIGPGAGGSPTGSEPADTTFTVLTGQEAYFMYRTGSNPGDADHTEIYYRQAGTTGWTNYWDLCSFNPASTPPCTAATDYTSEDSVFIQTPGNYEALVWDTAGDGSGPGSGGEVRFDTAGGSSGVVLASPSLQRLNSLISSEQIARMPIDISLNTPQTVSICGSVTACSSGTMAMFADVYNNAANGGYIEFGVGFPNALNSIGGANTNNWDGGADFSNFYLIVELEDNTPDDVAPTVEYDGHYTGVTSYVEGSRTLFLSIMDARNPVDTTAVGGPKLWYSTDGGNSYTDVDSTLLTTCATKNQVCTFSATTGDINAGTTVDYYWTFSDAAAVDNSKVPPQSPNAGRFPAVGAADLTFTVEDVYQATSKKLTALFEDVKGPDYQPGGSYQETQDVFDRQITYYAGSGEFYFEFDFTDCGSFYTSSWNIDDTCFWDDDVHSSGDHSLGHWDINWEGVATDCNPGATGCTGAPTNTLELDSAFGGILDISRYGTQNFMMVYDSNSNEWAIAATGSSIVLRSDNIDNRLDASLPDVVAEAYTPNMFTPQITINTLYADSGRNRDYSLPTTMATVTVPQGDVARVIYQCYSWCYEQNMEITNVPHGGTDSYNMGYTFGSLSSNSIHVSNTMNQNLHDIPNGGILGAGTWDFITTDPGYGDYTDTKLTVESYTGNAWPSGAVTPYDINSLYTDGYTAESFVIDLADSNTPSLGTNTGFGGVPFGTGTGEFSKICLTTAGHVMFMETSSDCTPDATETSAGGSWQGFAIGATKTGEDIRDDGLLWQIRNVEPDPDSSAPLVTGGQIGDSHALDRTVTYTISDNRYADQGVDTSPVPNVGPTIHYTITSDQGVVTSTGDAALVPTSDGTTSFIYETDADKRNICTYSECEWTYQFTGLTRGDTVSYHMTTRDIQPSPQAPPANSMQGDTYTFEVANPTNTLIVEWVEYKENSYTSNNDGCSMQVIMYDVTNEFEFHYDEDCYNNEKVGVTAIREDRSNFMEVGNWDYFVYGNPHTNNLRFTLSDTGDYLVETFELGMTPLPLVSSTQTVPVSSFTFSNDDRCDSNSDWSQYGVYCAGNFDIPDDFNFEFYGQSYDGSDPLNRIQATGSGFLHFVDDGSTNTIRIESSSSSTGCWPTSGAFRANFWTTCGGANNVLSGKLHMMAPYWSRETVDYCGSTGTTSCQGVWFRTLPFDGQGKTVTADITDDTTWYLIDSPIKVNPSDPSGYLSIDADLTIEPGVEVIIGENKGISFDGGVKADGTCSKFTAMGTSTDPITFNADRSVNSNALWHGLAFTSDCAGTTVEDRHVMQHVSISNTNHAAITAGSRPADSSFQGCGTATQDCDVGEFTLSDVSYSNVDSAFAHGSGQGTVVTMSNFAITDSRSSCFNFAQNTVATLTGTAGNPSTMTRCNTNNYDWAGAIASDVSGSNSGSLTMEYVNIVDSKVTLIRTDLQTITISDVTATTPTINDQWRWNNNGWTWENTGVSLGLSHGANSEVTVTNFNAPNYAQGWICAASKVSLTNVDLGTGFMPTGQHRFDINPYCGATTNVPGSMGANSVFDGVTAPDMTMYRTFPGTADQITVANEFSIQELGVTGGSNDMLEFTNMDVGLYRSFGCGANIKIVNSALGQLSSECNTPGGTSTIQMVSSTMSHSSSDSAIYMHATEGIFVDVDVTSTTVSEFGPYLYFGGLSSDGFLIDVTLNGNDCADSNGKTTDCHTSIDGNTNVQPTAIPEVYYGGFANSLAYRLGVDANTGLPEQIPEAGVTITASVLDSTGAELFPNKVIHRATTGNDGRASDVAVITGDHTPTTYNTHVVRASGSAGAGQANPALVDGTPATEVLFEDGVLQTGVPLADFGTYTIGSYADIRLVSPPVTLDNVSFMDCAWMATNETFLNTDPDGDGTYEFKGATMVLADDLLIDGCTVVLEGSQITFREDALDNPTLTIGNGGKLIMMTDTGTGDIPKIYGEGLLNAVDLAIESGGVLDMQSGTISNLLFDSSKSGQLEVPSGAELKLGGGAYLTATAVASNSYPMIDVDGGLVTVSSAATLAGSSNLGVGIELTNGGEVVGDGLTISNMAVGINSDGGSMNLDGYTSNGNTNGIVAKDGPKLPTMYSSAVLQGLAQNYPSNIGTGFNARELPNMDNCWFFHRFGCFEWEEYTVDLTSWVGQADYLQPAMMINYGGTYTYRYTVGGYGVTSWSVPYVTMDNLVIEVTDNSGASYLIQDENDVGYYPYSQNDPAVTNGGLSYLGGAGGAPFWDCNYGGESPNPWRWGERLDNYYWYSSTPNIGDLYGVTTSPLYPEQFGFRISEGTVPEPISVSSYPEFNWGFDDPITGRYGMGTGGAFGYSTIISNLGNWHDTTIGETRSSLAGTWGSPNYEACNARSPTFRTTIGSNMLLSWPTIDLTDSSIAKVELKFDMMHRYLGSTLGHWANMNRDSVELLTRSGSNPAAFGDYSEAVIGKGVILNNAQITDANVGIDLQGGTLANINGLDIDDPVQYGVRTSGTNSVYLDNMDVDDSGLGANNNYGFYAPSTSAGIQEITNSNFNGLGTAIYLNNDVETLVADATISNGNVGFRVGSQSSANHMVDTMSISNVNTAMSFEGVGDISMNDVDIVGSNTVDVEIADSSAVSFLDGIVDQSKVTIGSSSTGKFNRDRSYFAELDADGTPLADANVVMSSQAAATTSTGSTDANGLTSGLSFSIYDVDASGVTDYSAYFSTYKISSVAEVDYSWTDSTTNSGDFRYLQATPNLADAPYDSATATNFDQYSLTDQIDVRVCGTDSNYVMVSPCAGTSFSASGSRTYDTGMVEYGDDEGLWDGTSSMDLSGKAIMIDSGTLELRDGVTYTLDNAIVFDTGYTTEYGTGIAQWISDYPYGTTLKMHGGEVNGLYPKTANGDVVGLVIGGLQGTNENPLNLDIDGVTFNNIIGLATGTGDRDSSSFGSFNTYVPSTVEVKNSFIYYYRDLGITPTLFSDADYCLRLGGIDSATISGNTFANCVLSVAFIDSYYDGTSSTAHTVVGSNNVVIDGNTFVDTVGLNVMGWADSDTNGMVLSNNVMTCSTCSHVRFQDDTSFNALIDSNVFNGGAYGVSTDGVQRVNINDNDFNYQSDFAISAVGGDFNVEGNDITDPGQYAILADSLTKPTEFVTEVVAGVNTDFPNVPGQFVQWGGFGDPCPFPTWWRSCVSPDVYATNDVGQEMIIRLIAGTWASELRVYITAPDNTVTVWDPATGNFGQDGEESWNSGNPNIVLDQVGTYVFYLLDTYGDGPNGGGFEIVQGETGTWASTSSGPNTNPMYYWDPGVAGIQNTRPGYRGPYLGYSSNPYYPTAYSNTMDGVLLQNLGNDPVTYDFVGIDQYGDGFGSNCNTNIGMQVAPAGTWAVTTTGAPAPSSTNYGGPFGTWAGRINCISSAYPSIPFTSGQESDVLKVTLDPGYEMRFRLFCGSYCGEAALQWQEAMPEDNSWVGPTIKDNTITFDSVNNNPLGVGIQLSNCDVSSYAVLTEANTINIGQNAIVNDGCIWNDKNSVITGSDQSGSVGFDDDNTFGFDINLDGTTMSGFETGIHKTGGGILTITGDASFTAGDNGIGVHTEDIEVSVIGATFDGGSTGTGLMVEDSNYAWLYPMDVTGNVGFHAKNSEVLWDAGQADADTIMIAENVKGTVQSLTDPAGGSSSPASAAKSASSTTWIDARDNTRLTVIDWALDAAKVSTDATSIVDEANWLNIDADHLGGEPTAQVGLSIVSDEDYSAYSSPTFTTTMVVDGNSDDWVGGNALNPSGYAMPGLVGGPMYVTTDSGSLVLGFDSVDTSASDVYVYVDSNDMAGSSTGYNNVHTLPYDADFAIVVTSAGVDVYYYNAPNWVLDPGASAVSAQGQYLEVSVPLASIGGSVDAMNIVASIQDAGTDNVNSASPDQGTIVGTGAETFDSAYELALNKLDLSDGTMTNEVLLHRSFEFGNPPTTPHNYNIMAKTPAEIRHTCDYDWHTEANVVMDSTTSLSFNILRACPEITSALDDILVSEDSAQLDLDLSTFVDDEQDVEEDMEWEVTESNMDAFANILTDFSDVSGTTGTLSLTPINDQFGTFDLTFEVVDTHGQTAAKTITYTVKNINDAPVICDARTSVDPDCDNGDLYLYVDAAGERYNSRDEGFASYSKPLGKLANDTMNSFIRDMANEQYPVNQVYTWGATATCDQISVALQTNVNGVDEIVITENTNWEYGGVCDITLTLSDDGAENTDATPVVVQFAVAPVNDVPVIASEGVVDSADGSNSFQGVPGTSDYRLDLVEDTIDANALTFDLSSIKSDIDHLDADLSWTLEDTNTCDSSNYYTTQINGDILEFTLIKDATTNAEPWEVDMLNNNGIHQTRTANGRCEMTLTLLDSENPPSYMPNYELLEQQGYAPNNYQQESVSVTLSVEVDNVAENVPDYYLDENEGFDFNGVNNVMPGTYVPVDFSIYAGGDNGDYTYDHLLVVSLHSDGHTEIELPQYFTPPAFGESLDIENWEVYITDMTTEVWVEVDVVTCTPNAADLCTVNEVQTDNPESHNAVSSNQVFGKWSEPGRIGEDANGQQSNRRPAFEDKNWCNNMMSTNGGNEVAWSESSACQHTEQGYNGAFAEDWQTADVALPVTVTTIGALSVASFAPSIIAVALTGLFVSALVLAGRRDDDEEEFVEKQISDDDAAVSPVIATILMVAITVVLSGVVYVWAAQLADTDTKGVPRVTFSAENVDTGSAATDHWKITVGQAQTVLATQAVEVTVIYEDASGQIVSETTNLASTDHVYGFSPFNSDSLVTFGDVVTIDEDETISSFSTGDDIYVKTQTADGHKLVDATVRIVYSPSGDTQGAVLKTYTGLTWNQPV